MYLEFGVPIHQVLLVLSVNFLFFFNPTKRKYVEVYLRQPIPLATRSKAWVYVRSLARIAGSNPAGRDESLSLVSVVCCQVELSV